MIVNLPLENCSLTLITWVESYCLQQHAGLFSSFRKETPLREQIRLLKEELACKDEQLSHCQKKAAAEKGATIKNKNAAARSHAAGEESSISCVVI